MSDIPFQKKKSQVFFSSSSDKTLCTRRFALICSAVLLVTGSLLILIGIICIFLIPGYLNSQVLKTIIIASEEHPEFASFKSNLNGAIKYNKMYLFDIQNPYGFINGSKPRFVERGPYVFREYYSRNNIKFSSDQKLVSYSDTVQNVFVPEMSNGTLDDLVTIVNLPYVKVMSALGSESTTIKATGSKVLTITIDAFKEQLIPGIKAAATATAIQTVIDKVGWLNGGKYWLIEKMGGGCPKGDCTFVTTPFGRKYRLFLNTTLCSCIDCGCEADIIDADRMTKMMDPTDKYSFMNIEENIGVNFWLPFSTEYLEPNKEILMSHFNLTERQFGKLYSWLLFASNSDVLRENVFKELKGFHKVESWDDVAYRQWIAGDVVAVLSKLKEKVKSLAPNQPPEFPFAIDYLKSTGLIDGLDTYPWSLQTVDCVYKILKSNESWNMEYFLGKTLQRPGKAELFLQPSLDIVPTNYTFDQCWKQGMRDEGLKLLKGYFAYVANVLAYPQFKDVATKAGLLIRRTVGEILLGTAEPILRLVLEPSDPRFNESTLLRNDYNLSGPAMCRSSLDVENDFTSCKQIRTNLTNGTISKSYERAPSVYYTGIDNPDIAGQLYALNGYKAIENVFLNGKLQIENGAKGVVNGIQTGYSNGESYPPLNKVNPEARLSMFVTPLSASLSFRYKSDNSDHYGLKLMRFGLDGNQFTPNRPDSGLYDMSFSNTPPGILNLTEPRNFKVYTSQPHFLGYESNFETFEGIGPGVKEEHESFIDVEPVTGKAMRVVIRAQVVASTTSSKYDLFYPNIYKTDFLPVYWQEIRGEASKEQSAMVTGPLYSGKFLSGPGAGILVAIGFLLFVGGIVIYVYKVKKPQI